MLRTLLHLNSNKTIILQVSCQPNSWEMTPTQFLNHYISINHEFPYMNRMITSYFIIRYAFILTLIAICKSILINTIIITNLINSYFIWGNSLGVYLLVHPYSFSFFFSFSSSFWGHRGFQCGLGLHLLIKLVRIIRNLHFRPLMHTFSFKSKYWLFYLLDSLLKLDITIYLPLPVNNTDVASVWLLIISCCEEWSLVWSNFIIKLIMYNI